MKTFILPFIFLLSFSTIGFAQHNGQLQSVVQKGNQISFTIQTSSKIYVGNNIHYLHIGNAQFKISKQVNKNTIVFLLTNDEFNTLTNGSPIWMSYGNPIQKKDMTNEQIQILEKKSPNTIWSLGTFNSTLLTK